MKRLAISVLTLFSLSVQPASAAELRGSVVRVIDGDTFDIRIPNQKVRIRLCGIDTPERGQPNARKATKFLRNLIADQRIVCVPVGDGTPCDGRSRRTNRSRVIAQCFVGTEDVAAHLVRRDLACDWPKYSGGHYRRVAGGRKCRRR